MKNKIKALKNTIRAFIHDQDGLTIVEYAVAAGLITATVAAAFFTLGGTIDGIIKALDGYLNP